MPTRLRLSCRALLIIVLVRSDGYSSLCLATVQFSSPFTLTEFRLCVGRYDLKVLHA